MRRGVVIGLFALALLVSASAPSTRAQSGGAYELTWSTIDGGGALFSSGGAYEISGTIGQPDAGAMWGGVYVLGGGFWANAVAQIKVHLPLIMKSP